MQYQTLLVPSEYIEVLPNVKNDLPLLRVASISIIIYNNQRKMLRLKGNLAKATAPLIINLTQQAVPSKWKYNC